MCRLFPRLFRLSVNEGASDSDCYEMRNGSIVWRVSFRRSLRLLEEGSYEEMLSLLTNLFLCRDSEDAQTWKPSISGNFSAKAFPLALEGFHPLRAPSPFVWLGLAPPWVEAFCWLDMMERFPTMDNLRRRRMTSLNFSDLGVMCGREDKTTNHHFIHCELTSTV